MQKPLRSSGFLAASLRDAVSGYPGAEHIAPRIYGEDKAGPEDANWNADYASPDGDRPHLPSQTLTAWLGAVLRLRTEVDLEQ